MAKNQTFIIYDLTGSNLDQRIDKDGTPSLVTISNPELSSNPRAIKERIVHATCFNLKDSDSKIFYTEETTRDFARWRFPVDNNCILHTPLGDFKCNHIAYGSHPRNLMIIASPVA